MPAREGRWKRGVSAWAMGLHRPRSRHNGRVHLLGGAFGIYIAHSAAGLAQRCDGAGQDHADAQKPRAEYSVQLWNRGPRLHARGRGRRAADAAGARREDPRASLRSQPRIFRSWRRHRRKSPDVHHVLSGNDMRLSNSSAIRADTAWRDALARNDLDYFERRAGALHRALGYEWLDPAAGNPRGRALAQS